MAWIIARCMDFTVRCPCLKLQSGWIGWLKTATSKLNMPVKCP